MTTKGMKVWKMKKKWYCTSWEKKQHRGEPDLRAPKLLHLKKGSRTWEKGETTSWGRDHKTSGSQPSTIETTSEKKKAWTGEHSGLQRL